MKFRLTIKDPDGFDNGIRAAARQSFAALPLKPEELEDTVDMRVDAVKFFLEKWVKYNEYVTLEFDFLNGTATVVPLNEK